jgi:histidine triad (HIT) family protein
MEKCVFCEIIKGNLPAFKIYEDNYSIAILDINPRSKGMSLIIPRKHYENFSDDFELSDKCFKAAMLVANKIKKVLNPLFVAISTFPSEVKHFHFRIYPFYKEQLPLFEGNPLKMEEKELREIQLKLIEKSQEQVVKEEVMEESEKRSEEEIEWIKKYWQIV